MDCIRVIGGNQLNGTIQISGAKNAALPLMISSLLTSDTLTLENVPHLADVELLMRILGNHGVDISVNGKREKQKDKHSRTIHFTCRTIVDTTAVYDLVSKMRASFWVIGPLLARQGHARVSLPGGCAIGIRPIDLFIDSLTALGATMEIDGGYINARAPKDGLVGTSYTFPKVSVGATQVMIMAASLAHGDTVIKNAAREPEVIDLAKCLNVMGAKISGAGSDVITIKGVSSLSGARHKVLPDRIETGTYAMAVAVSGGDVVLQNTNALLLETVIETLRQTGVDITVLDHGIRVRRDKSNKLKAVDIVTAPFPGFPTDLQAQFMAIMSCSSGISYVTETIFENRFMHVQELVRLGAKISLSGQTAKVEGVEKLRAAPIMATDLRASVSLVIAALAAQGESNISRVYHLDRGFERLEEKLRGCGALVERIVE
ncbi:UDP-N-acetylglucosamine 1-carboxyvinyltransferase [Liberibacter crescens BT-1]|uniref:UDP-N-acetylglucosamine 1-carboxyvinyltransferase n=1 Tax=Liberibacter crescens (strain BT-1) TaxID=1215343 RepID=L0EVV3_LIBCB|nr:UDP-N-acetylglucosamine 1-carboxyvinyltransferase [Liberibacter crescens]AGA64985.1 UDP-N-acetylglucosamine 1-carboxyvinyltransferase [Liberibacter crescens BT-1]AMC13003.1 UDP-N-acetylglucosamine 1-carboxyvinyltransferase [Liberibacter crescens]